MGLGNGGEDGSGEDGDEGGSDWGMDGKGENEVKGHKEHVHVPV